MRDMVKFSLFLLGLPAVWMLAAVAAAAADDVPAARGLPGCATRCGNIDVPYPYGLDPQCAIHAGFELNCTIVDRTTKLFHSNLEVIKLSVQDGKAWLKNWISRECYNQTTMLYSNEAWMNLTGSPYVLSADDNKIIVLGCNSFAYMRSDSYIVGCLATCDPSISPKNGSCSGNAGCCQVDLPKGVKVYQGFFNSFYNTTAMWRNTPCNYITVMDKTAFNFSTTYLTSSVFYDRDESRSPVVMEWGITQKTCEAAKIDKAMPYACVSNYSECITNNAGYLCKCSKGFKGNPYVAGGCTDIDESQDKVTYPCAGICKNTVGSYDCSCSSGKSLINGVCVKNHKSVWMAPAVGRSRESLHALVLFYVPCVFVSDGI